MTPQRLKRPSVRLRQWSPELAVELLDFHIWLHGVAPGDDDLDRLAVDAGALCKTVDCGKPVADGSACQGRCRVCCQAIIDALEAKLGEGADDAAA